MHITSNLPNPSLCKDAWLRLVKHISYLGKLHNTPVVLRFQLDMISFCQADSFHAPGVDRFDSTAETKLVPKDLSPVTMPPALKHFQSSSISKHTPSGWRLRLVIELLGLRLVVVRSRIAAVVRSMEDGTACLRLRSLATTGSVSSRVLVLVLKLSTLYVAFHSPDLWISYVVVFVAPKR